MNPETAPEPGSGGESLVSLLNQLHDLREPPPVSMWPSTHAWWVLGAVLLLLLAVAIWRWLRHRRANAYRREALQRLGELEPALVRGEAGALAGLDELLRRTALAAFPRADVAALAGTEWAAYLDRGLKGHPGAGFQDIAPSLANAPYVRRTPTFDGAGLAKLARRWIRHHHA